jgi:spore coat protein U-like protein
VAIDQSGRMPFSCKAALRALPAAAAIAAALLALSAQAANTGTLSLSATVLSKNVCKFNSTATALNFGAIDPTSTAPVTVTLSLSYRCNGSDVVATWSVASDDGLHETGPGQPRMQHTTNAAFYLPYSLSFPASGSAPRNVNQTMTVTGTIAPASFAAAIAGAYSDTLVLSILP